MSSLNALTLSLEHLLASAVSSLAVRLPSSFPANPDLYSQLLSYIQRDATLQTSLHTSVRKLLQDNVMSTPELLERLTQFLTSPEQVAFARCLLTIILFAPDDE